MKTFSFGYRNLVRASGRLDTTARTLTLEIILLGALIGISAGVAVKAPAS